MKARKTNQCPSLIERDAKPVKAPYSTPTLRTFGAVNQLTTGNYSGAGFDTGNHEICQVVKEYIAQRPYPGCGGASCDYNINSEVFILRLERLRDKKE